MRLSLKSIAIGVLCDISTATACVLKGSGMDGIAIVYNMRNLSIEHPTGQFTVCLDITNKTGNIIIHQAGVIRTARLLSKDVVFVPENITNL